MGKERAVDEELPVIEAGWIVAHFEVAQPIGVVSVVWPTSVPFT